MFSNFHNLFIVKNKRKDTFTRYAACRGITLVQVSTNFLLVVKNKRKDTFTRYAACRGITLVQVSTNFLLVVKNWWRWAELDRRP